MERFASALLIACVCYSLTFVSGKNEKANEKLLVQGEKKLADHILTILDHYKQDEPIGVPGVDIPDPLNIPDMKHSFSVAKMNFQNMNVYGLSKFKILHVKSEMSVMQVNAALKIDKLDIRGNYTMSTWLSRSNGPCFVHLTDVYVQGISNLAVERDGKLRAQDIKMDITFSKIEMKFENLGFMGSMFQGIVNSVGTFLFDTIKPFILKEAYTTIRVKINENLDKVAGEMKFPNSISPLDMVVAETRNKVRSMKLDPYLVKDYNFTRDFYKGKLTHTWLTGLSSFHRVGNISLSMENNTLIADIEVGTQKLMGQTQWELNFIGGLVSAVGSASFSIDYLTIRIILAQPMDTRKCPQFRDLQIELGYIQARFDGAGTLDYLVEFGINILPNLLRYQIIDAIEGPIIDKVQEKLNMIDVENTIKSKLTNLDKDMGDGFKLNFDNVEMPKEVPNIEDFIKFH